MSGPVNEAALVLAGMKELQLQAEIERRKADKS